MSPYTEVGIEWEKSGCLPEGHRWGHLEQRWGSHHGLLTETGATETWCQVSLVRQTDALEKERRTVVSKGKADRQQ